MDHAWTHPCAWYGSKVVLADLLVEYVQNDYDIYRLIIRYILLTLPNHSSSKIRKDL